MEPRTHVGHPAERVILDLDKKKKHLLKQTISDISKNTPNRVYSIGFPMVVAYITSYTVKKCVRHTYGRKTSLFIVNFRF